MGEAFNFSENSRMYQVKYEELVRAEKVLDMLEREQCRVLSAQGPCKQLDYTVLAAAEIVGWMYVARKNDLVRRTLDQAIEHARQRFITDFHLTPPSCLENYPPATPQEAPNA